MKEIDILFIKIAEHANAVRGIFRWALLQVVMTISLEYIDISI